MINYFFCLVSPFAYMSNAIGTGALTVTVDNFVVLIQRAGWTGEWAGKVSRPGGHPEPEIVQKVKYLFSVLIHIYKLLLLFIGGISRSQ